MKGAGRALGEVDSFFANRPSCTYPISGSALRCMLLDIKCPSLPCTTLGSLTCVSPCDCHPEQETGHCHSSKLPPAAPAPPAPPQRGRAWLPPRRFCPQADAGLVPGPPSASIPSVPLRVARRPFSWLSVFLSCPAPVSGHQACLLSDAVDGAALNARAPVFVCGEGGI